MASLMKGIKFASKLANKNHSAIYIVTRNHWNKDFKPGPYPKTAEDCLAAAKKYNMSPKEYQPYPDTGLGFGDYPKLPNDPIETRDPYYPYDFPEHKRNFNEPIHAQIDLYSEDRYGTAAPLRYSMRSMVLTFAGVMTFFFVTYYWLEDKKMHRPVLAKQFPRDGAHYTFETK